MRIQAGFTLTELLVVIALMSVIAVVAISGFQDFANYQRHERQVAEIASIIEKTRVDARSAVGEEAHGIKFAPTSITYFSGASYNGSDPDNQVYTYNDITLQYAFEGGTDTVIFSQLTALPSATGTLLIISPTVPATTSLSITAAGVVQ